MYGLYLTYGQPRPLGRKCTRVQPARAYRIRGARHGCRLSLPRAPWARIVRGFNPAGQPAFKRTCRIRGVRRILMGGVLCLGCILRKDSPAR